MTEPIRSCPRSPAAVRRGGVWPLRLRRPLAALTMAAAVAACDEVGASDADGAVPRVDAGPSRVEPPAPRELPRMAPCPEGWVPRFSHGDVAQCDPWTAAVETAFCGFGEILVPGMGCLALGSPCAADGWPADLPTDTPVHFVREGAAGGDGSRDAPFGTISEGLEAASDGSIVAVATGTYDEVLALPAGIEIRGACPIETRLTSSTSPTVPTEAVVTARAAGASLTNLTVGLSERAGVFVDGGGKLTLRGVQVTSTRGFGIGVAGGELDADRVWIEGARASSFGGGRGITVEAGGRAVVRRARIEDHEQVSVFSSASLRIEDAVVRGSLTDDIPFPVFDAEIGASAELGGTLELARAVIERHGGAGLLVSSGAHATLEDVVVRDNHDEAIRLSDDAAATLRRVSVEPHPWSVLAPADGARLTAEDSVFTGGFVRGLSLVNVVAELRRVLLADPATGGIMLGAGSSLVAEDLEVRDTEAGFDGQDHGHGLSLFAGASAELTRAMFQRSREYGIAVAGAGTELTARDLVVRDSRGRVADGRRGGALLVHRGARATVERARMSGNRGYAVIADLDAELTLSDLRVEGTLPQSCVQTICPEEGAGIGLSAVRGARLVASGFEVFDSPLCGIHLADEGVVELDRGLVSGNLIGACVQVEGYDLDRLSDSVRYLGNRVNLDSTELPLPDPSTVPDAVGSRPSP